MHAMVDRGPYKVRIEETDIPPIEDPNHAIVQLGSGAHSSRCHCASCATAPRRCSRKRRSAGLTLSSMAPS